MILKLFRDVFYAISIIAIAVLSVLNTTVVYRYAIYKYELEKYTLLPKDILMDNYKRVISYVQNPLNKELVLNSVPMSNFGRIHFFEVKRIFIALYIMGIIFIIAMIFEIITNKNKGLGRKIVENLNNSVNIMALIFIFVSIVAMIDFDKAFYYFHKMFFRNNYWIFDSTTDPIINALPEEFFAIELILIICLLLIFTLVIKILHLKNKKL